MRELSVFVDESGGQGLETDFYLVTLVLHDQGMDIAANIGRYERALREKSLDPIPFHADPLLNGHDDYENMPIERRKGYLSAFMVFLQHLPVAYRTFSYRVAEFAGADELASRLRRDIVDFLFDNLPELQRYDLVKVYYDNAQGAVTRALHDAIEYAVFRDAVLYRMASPRDYYLSQAADLICALELVALKAQ